MTQKRVLVVGAGISGLACAFDLVRAGCEVVLLERAERAGGVIGTLRFDGCAFETGPNTVPAGAAAFRNLCGDLGIARALVASRPESKVRYLFHRGRLRALPRGPGGFLGSGLLSTAGKLRVLREPLVRHRRVPEGAPEPTFEAFLAERIGREATRVLAGAFVRGVYAAEIGELGARSAFPRLWELAQEHGGIARGMRARARARGDAAPLPGPPVPRSALLSFAGGLAELVDALAARLAGALRTGVLAERLERRGAGFACTTSDGERLEVDAVVLAVPAPAARALLEPLGVARAALAALAAIAHAEVTLVHMSLGSASLPPGFGFLVPPDEALRGGEAPALLGALFVSNLFDGRAPAGRAATTAIYKTSDLGRLGEHEVVLRAARDLAVGTGSGHEVRAARVQRWRDVIPRYAVGHDQRLAELLAALAGTCPSLHLAGSYTGGVSVDDCIARGREVARAVSAPESRP